MKRRIQSPAMLWLAPPALAGAEVLFTHLAGAALTRYKQLQLLLQNGREPGEQLQSELCKLASVLLRNGPLMLYTLFALWLALCFLSGRLRAGPCAALAACALACAGGAALLLQPEGHALNYLIPYLVRLPLIALGAALLYALGRARLPRLSKSRRVALLLLGLVSLASLTAWDTQSRLVERLALVWPDLGGLLALSLFRAPFELNIWGNLTVPWMACLLCALVLAALLARRKIKGKTAVMSMLALWCVLYGIVVLAPPLSQSLMQAPRPYDISQAFLGAVFGAFRHPLYPDIVFYGLPTSIIQALWVGLSCAATMALGRLSRPPE